MESTEVYIKNLEACKYRNLQQIAKTLSLPSNFKRVDLIELIAKKYKSEAEVQNIIDRVRQERLNQSKGKKRSRGRPKKTKAQGQAQKTLAARNVVSHSPPISVTPKRLSPYRHDSPDILAITPINPKRNLLDTINPHNRNPNVAATDRVLRSYSLQSERPNYALTSGIQGWKTQCCSSTNTELKVIEQTTKGYLRKRKADDDLLKQNFLVSNGGEPDQAIVPAKRQRIYPAQSQVDYEKTQEKQLKDQRNVPLPKTCDDFQRFSYMRDPTQPIYVQGGSKTLYNVPSDPTHVDRSTIDTSPEPLFNMQTKTPLQQSNVNNTSLDFTVQTVPTATALPDSAGPAGGAFDVTYLIQSDLSSSSSVMPDSAGPAGGAFDVTSPLPVLELCDLKMLDSSSSSSVMPNTTYSLSEMYEDALEVVAHDSDYMESIGMSEPVNCVFCGWAGSILLLDGHIRNDHACSIYKMDKSEWNITYTLKSLTECDAWLHRVIEYDDTLYLISVKYERPACFMATISLLSLDLLMPKEKNASMTLFNKSTGEPFSWTGHVPNFPPGSPSDDGANGLKLQLDLLDNTTVSQDIDVTVFVSIYNK